jgi:hypothetical protein
MRAADQIEVLRGHLTIANDRVAESRDQSLRRGHGGCIAGGTWVAVIAAARRGRHDDAVRLLAAAHGIYPNRSHVIDDDEKALEEGCINECRDALGAASVEALWNDSARAGTREVKVYLARLASEWMPAESTGDRLHGHGASI